MGIPIIGQADKQDGLRAIADQIEAARVEQRQDAAVARLSGNVNDNIRTVALLAATLLAGKVAGGTLKLQHFGQDDKESLDYRARFLPMLDGAMNVASMLLKVSVVQAREEFEQQEEQAEQEQEQELAVSTEQAQEEKAAE